MHGSPRSPEEEPALTSRPPVPSPPAIEEEANTQTTNPSEKVETSKPMSSKKKRGAKTPWQKRPTKKE
jgi:hypothetical protein